MSREEHFSAWARTAIPSLLRVAHLLTGDIHAGEDLLQDVLAKMYVKWPHIDQPGPYARRALANAATSRWRGRFHRHETVRDVDDHLAGAEKTQPTLEAELRLDLLAVLRLLPARQRAVVVLRYLEDRSDQEVADLLDITVGTVKSQTSRALARLRLSTSPAPPPLRPPADPMATLPATEAHQTPDHETPHADAQQELRQ